MWYLDSALTISKNVAGFWLVWEFKGLPLKKKYGAEPPPPNAYNVNFAFCETREEALNDLNKANTNKV